MNKNFKNILFGFIISSIHLATALFVVFAATRIKLNETIERPIRIQAEQICKEQFNINKVEKKNKKVWFCIREDGTFKEIIP